MISWFIGRCSTSGPCRLRGLEFFKPWFPCPADTSRCKVTALGTGVLSEQVTVRSLPLFLWCRKSQRTERWLRAPTPPAFYPRGPCYHCCCFTKNYPPPPPGQQRETPRESTGKKLNDRSPGAPSRRLLDGTRGGDREHESWHLGEVPNKMSNSLVTAHATSLPAG